MSRVRKYSQEVIMQGKKRECLKKEAPNKLLKIAEQFNWQ